MSCLDTLRDGGPLNFAGRFVRLAEGAIKKGDLYVGERNVGPQLLVAAKVDKKIGCIFPTTLAYPYDLHECVKVEDVPFL